MIRSATVEDAKAICDIYNHYVENSIISFEEQAVSVDDMTQRVARTTRSLPWLVAEEGGDVVGYACAGEWRERSAYRFSVKSTVYVAPNATGRGIGSQLYAALISELRTRSVHSIIAAIALPNPPSVALHETLGFQKVGHLREVGRKFGRWIDVGYWELIL
jgi:phosphinothricin acetyltransferase